MYILDTDMLSLLERDNAEALVLQTRLSQAPINEIVTTVITYEEQMRGWLSRVAQANTAIKILTAYARLQTHLTCLTVSRRFPLTRPLLQSSSG